MFHQTQLDTAEKWLGNYRFKKKTEKNISKIPEKNSDRIFEEIVKGILKETVEGIPNS